MNGNLKPLQQAYAHRHPGVVDALRFLDCSHLAARPDLQLVFGPFERAARDVLDLITADSPQVTLFLHKLVEAKDCAVRAQVAATD